VVQNCSDVRANRQCARVFPHEPLHRKQHFVNDDFVAGLGAELSNRITNIDTAAAEHVVDVVVSTSRGTSLLRRVGAIMTTTATATAANTAATTTDATAAVVVTGDGGADAERPQNLLVRCKDGKKGTKKQKMCVRVYV
jgi:hypothetical protein